MDTFKGQRVKQYCNKQFYEALNSNKRIRVFQGGSRSGKSWAMMQYIMYLITTSEEPLMISIVRKTLPALKRSVLRDFDYIAKETGIYWQGEFNKSELVFIYGKHKIEFFSTDDEQKLRGSTRDILWCEECNEISLIEFRQLNIRTKKIVLMSFNPSDPVGWFYDVADGEDSDLFISTYKDNKFLPEAMVKEIEKMQSKDPDFWRVYGEGQRAFFSQRQIFTSWNYIPEHDIPDELDWFLGCDFGFTNDPSCILKIAKKNNRVYVKELLYKTGMTNMDIANFIKEKKLQDTIMYCDSAEPKSIEELRQLGCLAKAAVKGAGSINAGISLIKEFDIYVSDNSHNVKREQTRYVYEELKDGTITNKPVDKNNHTTDALRYGLYSRYGKRTEFFVI